MPTKRKTDPGPRSTREYARMRDAKAQPIFDAIKDLNRLPAEEYMRWYVPRHPPIAPETIVALTFIALRHEKPDSLQARLIALTLPLPLSYAAVHAHSEGRKICDEVALRQQKLGRDPKRPIVNAITKINSSK